MYDAMAHFSRISKSCSGSKETFNRMEIMCVGSIYVPNSWNELLNHSTTKHHDANFRYSHN